MTARPLPQRRVGCLKLPVKRVIDLRGSFVTPLAKTSLVKERLFSMFLKKSFSVNNFFGQKTLKPILKELVLKTVFHFFIFYFLF